MGLTRRGAGNQLTVRLLRHSQRKRGATARLNLRSMVPVLDPTKVNVYPNRNPKTVGAAPGRRPPFGAWLEAHLALDRKGSIGISDGH
jgi:hypothetical protein